MLRATETVLEDEVGETGAELCDRRTSVSSRTLKVRSYLANGICHYEIEVTSGAKYKQIKAKVAKTIGLCSSSLAIFGLFAVYEEFSHYPLKEVCKDEDTLPSDVNYVALNRLCFDRELEQRIIDEDYFAMRTLFYETSYFIKNGTCSSDFEEISRLVDRVKRQTKRQRPVTSSIKNKGLLESKRTHLVPLCELSTVFRLRKMVPSIEYSFEPKCPPLLCEREARHFIEELHTLDMTYWSYYYRFLDCTLCGENCSLIAAYLNLNNEFKVDVALNSSCLSFIGTTSSGLTIHLVDFPWMVIQWLSEDHNSETVSFEVPIKDLNGKTQNIIVDFKNREYHLLYSIAEHIAHIQANIKAENIIHNFLLCEERILRVKSYVPELNTELGLAIERAIVSENTFKMEQTMKFEFREKSGHSFFNEMPFCVPIDLWYIHLCNSLGIVSSSRYNWLGLPTVCLRYTEKNIEAIFKKPICEDVTRNITVHTYYTEKEPITIDYLPSKYVTVERFKLCLLQNLKIDYRSLAIFGLFECPPDCQDPLDNNGTLCMDQDPMPSGSRYVFRRLSFDKDLERKICIRDYQAHLYILAETAYMIRQKHSFPSSSTASTELASFDISQYSQYSHHNIGCGKYSQCIFFDSILDIYRWKFYYRAPNMLPANLRVKTTEANYCIAGDAIYMVDASGDNYEEIPLSSIRCVKTQRHTKHGYPGTIMLETTHPCKEIKILKSVSFLTSHPKFFYSIAKHVLNQQYTRSSSKFLNSAFWGSKHTVYTPGSVLVTINPGFII